MSYHKSIGIDVGVIAKGLNYKVSLANSRIDALESGSVSISSSMPYEPVSLGNWITHGACGCTTSISNVKNALDHLAQFRAETLERVHVIEQKLNRNSIT